MADHGITAGPDYIPLPLDLQQLLTPEQAWHYSIIPKSADKESILFFMDERSDPSLTKMELEILLGKNIILEKTSSSLIQKTLTRYYRKKSAAPKNTDVKTLTGREDFVQELISEAKSLGASDIHIEAYEEKCRIRLRIDGLLIERYQISKSDYPSLINKLKIRANLDIAEKRLPQDGRIFFNHHGHKFDIRVSVLPSLYGEKIVLRILSNDAADIDIRQLGFADDELENYLEGIRKPHGIVLISGPTGSGKTTTLYATLKILNKSTRNILTVEDPIEYTLPGINQVQVKEDIGFTFASALRTFLRQDPDIIMLGEIRDMETARMAIRLSLTGHLVLSTIHTNSAWGTISRLTDMGVAPFLLASTINTTAAQRLVRLLCPHCKTEESLNEKLYPRNFRPPVTLTMHYTATGCEHCHYTGYKGRKAIYEVIPVDHELGENIKNNNFAVTHLLKERKIRSLADNAFSLLEKGETSLDEIYPMLLND